MIKAEKLQILISFLFLLTGCATPSIINEIEVVNDGVSTIIKKQETELWQENWNVNNDYVGTIIFDSGLLVADVVQGKTDNDYLRTNWKTLFYDKYGSICLGADYSLEDQNILIFGHTVYKSLDPTGSLMFTPLHQLKDNIEDNSIFKLILADETRVYQVAYAYDCVLIQENGVYYAPDSLIYNKKYYSSEEISLYQENIKSLNHSNSGLLLTEDDKLLTFQTCEEGDKTSRLIVVSKLINAYKR